MLPFSVVNTKIGRPYTPTGFPEARMPVVSSAQAPITIFSAAKRLQLKRRE
jgi:hypothetical protein